MKNPTNENAVRDLGRKGRDSATAGEKKVGRRKTLRLDVDQTDEAPRTKPTPIFSYSEKWSHSRPVNARCNSVPFLPWAPAILWACT